MHSSPLHIIEHYGYWGEFIVFVTEMLGAPFPAETTLTLGGVAWGQGGFSFAPLWLAAVCGNITGSAITYALGRTLGRRLVLRYGRYIRLTEARFAKTEVMFQQYRGSIVVFGKFVSGVRLLVPVMAGINRMSLSSFTLWNTISAGLWAAVFLLEGRYLFWVWKQFHYLVILALLVLVGLSVLARRMWLRRVHL